MVNTSGAAAAASLSSRSLASLSGAVLTPWHAAGMPLGTLLWARLSAGLPGLGVSPRCRHGSFMPDRKFASDLQRRRGQTSSRGVPRPGPTFGGRFGFKSGGRFLKKSGGRFLFKSGGHHLGPAGLCCPAWHLPIVKKLSQIVHIFLCNPNGLFWALFLSFPCFLCYLVLQVDHQHGRKVLTKSQVGTNRKMSKMS